MRQAGSRGGVPAQPLRLAPRRRPATRPWPGPPLPLVVAVLRM